MQICVWHLDSHYHSVLKTPRVGDVFDLYVRYECEWQTVLGLRFKLPSTQSVNHHAVNKLPNIATIYYEIPHAVTEIANS